MKKFAAYKIGCISNEILFAMAAAIVIDTPQDLRPATSSSSFEIFSTATTRTKTTATKKKKTRTRNLLIMCARVVNTLFG